MDVFSRGVVEIDTLFPLWGTEHVPRLRLWPYSCPGPFLPAWLSIARASASAAPGLKQGPPPLFTEQETVPLEPEWLRVGKREKRLTGLSSIPHLGRIPALVKEGVTFQ